MGIGIRAGRSNWDESVQMSTASELLSTLQHLGRPQIAAIYKRHGSGENVFGVLTSEIAKLGKKLKVNQPLALELWKTENAEARILALLVADPAKVTRALAQKWLQDGPSHFLGCYLCGLFARSPITPESVDAWMQSPKDSIREIGYGTFAVRMKLNPTSIQDAEAERVLAKIEEEIHDSLNWARYAMNSALISIGVHKPALRNNAIATARRIGKVHVDHGETGCKTPDALRSIDKASKRKPCP
jgi:3-methyladenine DNA glycosylase AlkD